jgi:transposase
MTLPIPDARSCSNEVLDALRIRAVAAHQQGYTQNTIADILGVWQSTVSHWCTAYDKGGADELPGPRTGRPTGAGRRLSEEQENELQDVVLNQKPQALGIASTLWTRAAVREVVQKRWGIDLSLRGVGEYLHRWGFTPQRPLRHAYRQDPEAVRRWLDEEYPKIKAKAKREGAEIHWGDELGVDADRSPQRGYAPCGQTPAREVTGAHVRVSVLSTITNQGKLRFMVYTQTMTAALFLTFVEQLLSGSRRKIILIVDRLQAHLAGSVAAWVEQHADRLEIFYLPAKAPALNPDEYLNNEVKGTVNTAGLSETQEELSGTLGRLLGRLAALPDHVANCFQHPRVAYAAAGGS